MVSTDAGTLIEDRPEDWNACPPMLLRAELASKVMVVRALQPKNAPSPMVSTDAGTLIAERPEDRNACPPMLLSAELASKMMVVRALQPPNEPFGIATTEAATNRLPSTTSEQLHGNWTTLHEASTARPLVRYGVYWNAFKPTDSGVLEQAYVTDARAIPNKKASSPMVSTDAGMLIAVRPEEVNAFLPMLRRAELASKVMVVRALQN